MLRFIFVSGTPPILGRKLRYYVDGIFSARARIPSSERSDEIAHDWSVWTKRRPQEQISSVAESILAKLPRRVAGRPHGTDLLWGGAAKSESMGRHLLIRNQQVAGSIPAGGSWNFNSLQRRSPGPVRSG